MSTPAPPPPKKAPPPATAKATKTVAKHDAAISSGIVSRPLKLLVYGPGGVGKTELLANSMQCGLRPIFIDLENGSHSCDVHRIDDIDSWEMMRGILHNEDLLNDFDTVVVDSFTKAEELATKWTLANVPHEKGHFVDTIEGYGFGKGITHNYETFLQLLGDLDALNRRGKKILCVAHECTSNVPNPAGDDWIRYEPRLQSPASGKSSIRHRVKEWVDHLLFIGYDTFSKDGKATGAGTRTIYPTELPTHWAKSRSLSDPIPYERGSAALWEQLLNTKG